MLDYLRVVVNYEIPHWIRRKQFEFHCRGILKTPPVPRHNDDWRVISLLSHRDLRMYLISAKSFYYYFKRGRFIVVNDGSLTGRDKDVLRGHFEEIEIVPMADVKNTRCPKRGCWERLLFAADLNQDKHVIVLDADMITQGPIPEVGKCLDEGGSFIMGLRPGQVVQTMEDIWRAESDRHGRVNEKDKNGIQNVVETNLDKVSGFEKRKYLQGSGGFHGFSKGAISRERVENFSAEMEGVFGRRWHEWGTEQIMACLLIAESSGGTILPYPKYAIYYGGQSVDYAKSLMLHFIGTHRFKNDFYLSCAEGMLKILV